MLAKPNRLTKETDFKLLARTGRPFYSFLFTVKVAPRAALPLSRFGIVISAKVSKKATVRNKLKRQLTEIIRLNLKKIKTGRDVMILVKAASLGKSYQELEAGLAEVFDQARLLESD